MAFFWRVNKCTESHPAILPSGLVSAPVFHHTLTLFYEWIAFCISTVVAVSTRPRPSQGRPHPQMCWPIPLLTGINFLGPAGWPGLPSRAKPQSLVALGVTGLQNFAHRLTFRHESLQLSTAVRGRHPFGCVLCRLCSRCLGYLGVGLGLVDGLLNDALLIL